MKILSLLVLASLFFLQSFAQEYHPTGLIRRDLKNSTFFKPSDIEVKSPKTFVDHSSEMPPVGNQGAIGSCVAWAAAYYFKSHQEYMDYGWSTTDTKNICSPSFVYNQINGGADYGADFEDAFKMLVDNGCCTISEFPYSSNFTNWPTESMYLNALKFRCSQAYAINISNSTGINQLKQYISDGNCAVIGIPVYPNFDNIQNFNYTYCLADVSGAIRGYHAVTIVGYDDSKVTHDGVGAFKLVNSWGTTFGLQGYWWMSYEAVMSNVLSEQTAYYATDKIHYTPGLVGIAKFTHSSRLKMGIKFGIGSQSSPSWSRTFFNFNMGSHTDQPFPNNNIVFDLTDGISGISQTDSNRIWVCASDTHADNRSGVINYFSAANLNWNMRSVSSETPVTIPDYTTGVYANLRLGPNYTDNVGSFSVDMDSYSIPGSMTPKSTIRNSGRNTESFNVTMNISSVINNSPVYSYTSAVSNVAPGECRQVTFQNWISTAGNYRITIFTSLAGDQNRNDDTLRKEITIMPLPQTPMLISPVNGASNLYTDVVINWNKSVSAEQYYYQFASDAAFNNIVRKDSSITDTVTSVCVLNPSTTYYWRVRAKNHVGSSDFSAVRSLRTMGFPNTVNLCSPANNSSNISIPVTLNWYKASEQSKSINNYLVKIVTDTVTYGSIVTKVTSDTTVSASGLIPYTQYFWRVSARNQLGWGTNSVWWKFTTGSVGISNITSEIPSVYKLYSNYPNPFNPVTAIKFDVPENVFVKIRIYDITGKEISTPVNEFLKAGSYRTDWNASSYSSGVYYYRIETGKYSETRKMILVK
ncbi:MAG: T9SS type A sorting domain-containing protein [Ignavibacteria bacterium]|nr:T9SS type A sorting domain-containing protein [Ignavibacteria bacterium]